MLLVMEGKWGVGIGKGRLQMVLTLPWVKLCSVLLLPCVGRGGARYTVAVLWPSA